MRTDLLRTSNTTTGPLRLLRTTYGSDQGFFHALCSLLALAVVSASAASFASDSQQLLRLLPEQTGAAVLVEEFSIAWQRYLKVATRQGTQPTRPDDGFWKACGTEPADFASESVATLLRAEIRQPSGSAAKMVLAIANDAAQASRILRATGERLARTKATQMSVDLGKTAGVHYTWRSQDTVSQSVVQCAIGKLLVCSNDLGLAKQISKLADAASTAATAGPPGLNWSLLTLPSRSPDDRLRVLWYSNAWAGRDAVESMPEERRANLDRAKRHGLDGVQASCGLLTFTATGTLRSHTVVYAPQPYRSTLRLLQLSAAPTWQLPTWIPDKFSDVAVFHGNVPMAFEYLGTLFDDFYADGIEGTYDDILADLKDDSGLGIDLQRALYRHLGPRVVVLRGPSPNVGSGVLGKLLIAFQTGQPAAVAATLERLMVDDPEVVKRQVPGCDAPLWEIQNDGGVPNSGAIVAHEYLILAEDVTLIQQALAAKGGAADRLTQKARELQQHADWPEMQSPCMLLAWSDTPEATPHRESPIHDENDLLALLLLGSPASPGLQHRADTRFDVALVRALPVLKTFPLLIGAVDKQGFRFYTDTTDAAERHIPNETQ